jgi:hypothetical protein
MQVSKRCPTRERGDAEQIQKRLLRWLFFRLATQTERHFRGLILNNRRIVIIIIIVSSIRGLP